MFVFFYLRNSLKTKLYRIHTILRTFFFTDHSITTSITRNIIKNTTGYPKSSSSIHQMHTLRNSLKTKLYRIHTTLKTFFSDHSITRNITISITRNIIKNTTGYPKSSSSIHQMHTLRNSLKTKLYRIHTTLKTFFFRSQYHKKYHNKYHKEYHKKYHRLSEIKFKYPSNAYPTQ